MSYIYTWTDADQSILKREDAKGNLAFIPADPANSDYAKFLASGAVAEPFGPPPPPPTTAEKVDRLLTDYNLTRDELRAALSATQEISES